MRLETSRRLRNLPSAPRNSPQPVGRRFGAEARCRPVHTGTPIAPNARMRRSHLLALSIGSRSPGRPGGRSPSHVRAQGEARYRIETRADRTGSLAGQIQRVSIGVIGKAESGRRRAPGTTARGRRAGVVERGRTVVQRVADAICRRAEEWSTFLVVYLPGQLFGAYEFGRLVRWGPVSTGSRSNPTSAGCFALNWRSTGRASTVDPDWFMRWYFNFGNREGLAFHAYPLPGYPASHGCIRLLERDAQWLFEWGQTWLLDPSGTRVLTPGTPVFIVGRYDFDAPPPWRSLTLAVGQGGTAVRIHDRRRHRLDAHDHRRPDSRHRLPDCAIHTRRRDR